MKTTDLFKINRSSQRLNESIEKIFGKKLNLESFDLEQLQDARNKLRTQVSQIRGESGFNENLENDAFTQAQWMLDAINAEIAEREEFIADAGPAEVEEGYSSEVEQELAKLAQDPDWNDIYDAMGRNDAVGQALQDMAEEITGETGLHMDDDIEKIIDIIGNRLEDEYGDYDRDPDEGGETDDNYAMASAGYGSDEDYGDFPESIQGEEMTKVTEGEIQQASAIVTAKTMVDRVGRWIEELSGMENDTLLQLGDSIRDEMGSEQAKNFISAVAPAIQQALENLKQTRETLSTGVRQLTGEEQGAEMLGAEPTGSDELGATAPDTMNSEPEADTEPTDDEFAAAEPAAGGAEAAGREQRESIDRSSRLLKVLAG